MLSQCLPSARARLSRGALSAVAIVAVSVAIAAPPPAKTVRVKAPVKAAPAAPASSWQDANVEIVAAGRARINYAVGVVKATGLGALAPPTLSRSRAQDTLDARQTALGDALRTLATATGRVRVTANTRVENLVLKNDDVRVRVDGVLDKAEVIEESLSPSGVYRVVVQIPLSGAGSVSEAVGVVGAAPVSEATAPPPQSKKPELGLEVPVPDGATYTGLVVDCRGKKIVACMSPKLYDTDDREVYGTLAVSPDYANDPGIVGYPRSMDEALRSTRAGTRPLVVRAVGRADKHRFFPVVERKDAQRIRAANERDKFLERTAVVFVVDPL